MFVAKLAICVMLFFSCNGTPMEEIPAQEVRRRGDHLYTEEEEHSIIDELLIHIETFGVPSWSRIAQVHERKRRFGTSGFNAKRTTAAMTKYFHQKMLRGEGLVRVPDFLKEKFKYRKYYTEAENNLIIEELLAWPGRTISNKELWKTIAKKHSLRMVAGDAGFHSVRTPKGLFAHFRMVLSPRKLVPDDVMRKFRAPFPKGQGASIASSSTEKGQSSKQSEELNGSGIQYYDFFRKDLDNAPDDANDDDNELTKLKL